MKFFSISIKSNLKTLLSIILFSFLLVTGNSCDHEPATRGEWFEYINESDHLSKTVLGSKLRYDFILIPNELLNLIESENVDREYSTVYIDISVQETFKNEKDRIFNYLNWAIDEYGCGTLKAENNSGLRIDKELIIKEKRPVQSDKIRLIGTFKKLKPKEEYTFIYSHEGIPEYQLHFRNLSYR